MRIGASPVITRLATVRLKQCTQRHADLSLSMVAVFLSALLITAVAAVIGHAVCALCTWERSWIAPAVGFAVLLIAGGAVQQLPGHATTVAIVVAVAVVAALLMAPVRAALRAFVPDALLLALGVVVLAGLPLLAAGRADILGAGDQNDMVQHLTTAYWLLEHDGPTPVLIKAGYPLGPHGLAAAVSQATGISVMHAFDGLTLAIPVLTALAALAATEMLRRPARLAVCALAALCYLAASYLVTGAFKETAEALFLLAVVLGLRELTRFERRPGWRSGVPLGLLVAGTVYTYSYPGIGWPVAAAALFSVLALAAADGSLRSRAVAALRALPVAIGAVVAGVLAVAPQAGRLSDFSRSSFPHQAREGTGNLVHALSPLETFGVWLRADFRFNPDPFVLALVLGIAAVAAAAVALVWWVVRRDFALPAGIVSAGLIFWWATLHKNVYNQAKGLAIAAPLVALATTVALAAGWRVPRFTWAVRSVAACLLLGMAASSFLALRDGPVGSDAHAADLASVRKLVHGRTVLTMDQDDFSHWYLRGIDLGTGPLLYPTLTVPVRQRKPWRVTRPFDFDSWPAHSLDRFDYVIEPRSAFRSSTPRSFRLARTTRWYWVWRRTRKTPRRRTIEPPNRPARVLDCTSGAGAEILRRGGVAGVIPRPVVRNWHAWQGQPRFAGQSGTLRVHLPAGRWDLSMQYISTTGMYVTGPGLHTTLPAHLGRIGPYWLVGTVSHPRRGNVRIRVSARRPPLAGRLLGARGLTRALDVPRNLPLQHVAFTRHGARERVVPVGEACGRFVDWYRPARH
jgi:hypothetical protein